MEVMREVTLKAAPSFQSGWRRLRRGLPGFIKGVLRRQAEAWLPNRDAAAYKLWRATRIAERAALYTRDPEPGLFSVLTAVWNGSPPSYLTCLADLLAAQNKQGACEWVILDNGCTNKALLACFEQLKQYPWVRIEHAPQNIGITRGLRRCLEVATGRYVLPVDADDYLYPDALRVITRWIEETNYPVLLYSDEDKLAGAKFVQPYLKPDWDPVLLLNSAYIAHLGIVDRLKALELGAYSDGRAEGSPDWDLFVRFLIAGYQGVHIPEVLYGWRVHAHSTADDAANKPYVHTSQRVVLQRFLDAHPDRAKFTIENSPLLSGAAHWRFVRAAGLRCPPIATIRIRASDSNVPPKDLLPLAQELAGRDGLIRLASDALQPDDFDWAAEAVGIFELHPDTVMVGGRIRNGRGYITEAGVHFGVGEICASPHAGRPVLDPGYFTHIWKQRSVSAVSVQFAVVKAAFLRDLLQQLPSAASLAFLGAWAGAYAMKTGQRVVYSPYLSGVSDVHWNNLVSDSEVQLFADRYRDIIPDRRYYSCGLSLAEPFALGEMPALKFSCQPETCYHQRAAKNA